MIHAGSLLLLLMSKPHQAIWENRDEAIARILLPRLEDLLCGQLQSRKSR